MLLKEVFSTDIRANLGETLDKVYDTKVPVIVKKRIAGGTKDFVFISKPILDRIYEQLKLNVFITEEKTGEFTLELKELDLLTYGETLEEAIESLIDDIYVYAEEYLDNIDLYSNAPNRKEHLVYLLKIWGLDSRENMAKCFNFVKEMI